MRRLSLGIAALLVFMTAPLAAEQASDLLYVWAWDKDRLESDFLAVVDVDEESPTFGDVLNTLPVGVVGFAHHTEHQMTDPTRLFVNSFSAGKSFVLDMTEAREPKAAAAFTAVGDRDDRRRYPAGRSDPAAHGSRIREAGLAKVAIQDPASLDRDQPQSPTLTTPAMTEAGMILGPRPT